MDELFFYIGLAAIAALVFILYLIKAERYCAGLLAPKWRKRNAFLFSVTFNTALAAGLLYLNFPVVLKLILLYVALLFEFQLVFQGKPAEILFVSGVFMFHIMNIKLLLSSLYIMAFEVKSVQEFEDDFRYNILLTTVLLLLFLFLEAFEKFTDQRSIQLLLKNRGQLLFATSSMQLINLYLLLLSISYNGQAYTSLTALFLFCTSVLLFGAFYTSFRHAVKMSVMMGYQAKSLSLEHKLEQSYQNIRELQDSVFIDALTGVHNRKYGMEKLERLLEEAAPFTVCFLDIDHLKQVNDKYGHGEGERYLVSAADILEGVFRGFPVCRMGGDEFLVLLPDTTEEQAEKLARNACENMKSLPFSYAPSFSYGIVSQGQEREKGMAAILQEADQRMYAYKKAQSG